MTAEKENKMLSPHLIDGIWDLAGTICNEILDDKEHENQEQISYAIQSFVDNEKFFPKCKCNNKIVKLATEMLKHKDCMLVILTILGVVASGSISLIALIFILILAWNYIKLLFEAAERYVLLGVLVYTAPVAFAMGASETTSGIFKTWCKMVGGQIFLLLMNAWCLRIFTSMVGTFLSNPLSV